MKGLGRTGVGLMGAMAIVACNQTTLNTTLNTYDATATVTYTWQASYTQRSSPDRPNDTRIEQFESVSLVNQNGLQPPASVTGPDSRGLWWPALPSEPTVDELESRLQQGEQHTLPELIKSVAYAITVDQVGTVATLPTNHNVYRAVAKAYPNQRPLEITYGPRDESVINAEIR
ncbi:MAG: hypothetical protein AAFZ80_03570 [Cyanobacteria bacterium P01_A01_bin.105]